MEKILRKLQLLINTEMYESVRYNNKITHPLINIRDKTLWFTFKHSETPFHCFISRVSECKDEDKCYNALIEDLVAFIINGRHLKMMKNPIKALKQTSLKVGLFSE